MSDEQARLTSLISSLSGRLNTLSSRKKKVDKAIGSIDDLSSDLSKIDKSVSKTSSDLSSAIKGSSGIDKTVSNLNEKQSDKFGLNKTGDKENLRDESVRLSTEISSVSSSISDARYDLNNLKTEEGKT